jgi:hypothetical protein
MIIAKSTEAQVLRESKGCRFGKPNNTDVSRSRFKMAPDGYHFYNSSTPYYITATDDTIYANWNYENTLEKDSDGNYLDKQGHIYYNPNGRQFYTDSLGNKIYLPNTNKDTYPIEYNRNKNNYHFENGGVYY